MIICLLTISFCKIEDKSIEVYNKIIQVNAKAAIVMDALTKEILYEKNIHEPLLPASITKILTCLTAIYYYSLSDLVFIDENVNKVMGSKIYITPGDIITIEDLLYGALLCSGNDAALYLAKHYSGDSQDFIYLMNKLAVYLGAKHSSFTNPSGLDNESENYTTAYDMAMIMVGALTNETFRKINQTKKYVAKLYSGKTLYFVNKHRLIKTREDVIGGKTGYTKKAGRTLVTCFKEGNRELIVVTFACSNDWQVHCDLIKNYQE